MCSIPTLLEKHEGKSGVFYTTPLFWDCECEEEYIHPAFEEFCPHCNSRREDAPDARVSEIFSHVYEFRLPVTLVDTLIAAANAVDPSLTEMVDIPF